MYHYAGIPDGIATFFNTLSPVVLSHIFICELIFAFMGGKTPYLHTLITSSGRILFVKYSIATNFAFADGVDNDTLILVSHFW